MRLDFSVKFECKRSSMLVLSILCAICDVIGYCAIGKISVRYKIVIEHLKKRKDRNQRNFLNSNFNCQGSK